MEEQKGSESPVQITSDKMEFGTLKITDSLNKKALEAVTSRLDSVQEIHNQKVKEWDEIETIYSSESTLQDKETLAQINSRQMYNAVEDWTAVIVDGLLSVSPCIKVKPRPGKSIMTADQAYKIEKSLWRNAEETDFQEQLELGTREGVKTGIFCFKDPYRQDENWRLVKKQRPKMLEFGKIKIKLPVNESYLEQEITTEGTAPLIAVDPRNLFFRKDRITWVIERMQVSLDTVKRLKETYNIYDNLDGLEKLGIDAKETSDPETTAASLDGDVILYEGHHIPIKFESEDGTPDLVGQTVMCIVTVANKERVVRVQVSPYREVPYLITSFIPRRKSTYGIGVGEAIKSLVIEYNTRRNQSLDANTFGLYGMIIANTKFIKDRNQLKIRQNGVIEIRGTDRTPAEVLSFIRPPVEYVSAAQGIMQDVRSEIGETTRLKTPMTGEKISPTASATEAANMYKESLKSVKIILNRIDRNIVQKYFERAYIYLVLNRKDPWFIEVEPPKGGMNEQTNPMAENSISNYMEISPEDIYTDGIEIDVLGSKNLENEVVQRNQTMQFIDLAAKYASQPMENDAGQQVVFDMYRAFNKLAATFGETNPSSLWKVLPPPPPPAPEPGMPEDAGQMLERIKAQVKGGGAPGAGRPPAVGGQGTGAPMAPRMQDKAPQSGMLLRKPLNAPTRNI